MWLIGDGTACWRAPFGALDWTPCFRRTVVNGLVPFLVGLGSGIVFFAVFLVDRSLQQQQYARQVARLNPHSSHFYEPGDDDAVPHTQAPPSAATRVFRTENAVVVDAALAIKDDLSAHAAQQRRHQLQTYKAALELVGALILFASHCVGIALRTSWEWEASWTLYWLYAFVLFAYACHTDHTLFVQKLVLTSTYVVAMVSNMRTVLVAQASHQIEVVTGLQLVMGVIVCIPSLVFPLSTIPTRELRAMHASMHRRDTYDELRTAIATPRRRGTSEEDPPTASYSSQKDELPPPPEQHASLISRALFAFVTPIVWRHYWVPITLGTVPQLLPNDRAAAVVATFRTRRSEDEETVLDGDESNVLDAEEEGAEDAEDDLDDTEEAEPVNPGRAALLRRLLVYFAPILAKQLTWGTAVALLSLAPVVFLSRLLNFFTLRGSPDEATPPTHMGLLFATGMFLSFVLLSISQSQALFTGRRVCIQTRAVLIAEILSKTLRRSISASLPGGASASDGQVTNLVSVDVFKVSEYFAYIHFLFPEQPGIVVLCIVYLIRLLGSSALVGLTILLLVMPLQAYISRLIVAVQERMLSVTDERLDLAGEVLACIKTVKFFAWEGPFATRMRDVRTRELRVLCWYYILNVANGITFVGAPMLVTLATFGVHTTLFGRALTAEKAFTALAIFNTLRRPLSDMPQLILYFLNMLVSLRRIEAYLEQEETEKYDQLLTEDNEAAQDEEEDEQLPPPTHIGFTNATFTHSATEEGFALRDLNCAFPVGAISVVVGAVGAGKSSLLLALLGEMHRVSGTTTMPCPIARSHLRPEAGSGLIDSVAYCSQSAWLLGTTVRQNILFGSRYDDERYHEVLRACALEPDLEILEFHDETEVGEKGTSLSGGQKARIALARAFYSPARHILIDDALSAVDAHTARHLFQHCFCGPLARGRTIILVTHAVSLMLPAAQYAVVMQAGRVLAQGTPKELLQRGQVRDAIAERDLDREEEEEEHHDPLVEELSEEAANEHRSKRHRAQARRDRKLQVDQNEEKEHRQQSSTVLYGIYMGAFARPVWLAVVLWATLMALYVAIRSADVGSGAWLRNWARSYDDTQEAMHRRIAALLVHAPTQLSALHDAVWPAAEPGEDRTLYYLRGYAAITLGFIALTVARDLMQMGGSLRASSRLYEGMVRSLMSARPQFYDRTPIGRIMNRLSKDIQEIDQEMSPMMQLTLENLVSLVAVIGVICWATPRFLFLVVFVMGMYYMIGALYLASSRDLKRIESVQRSPLYTLVGETLAGTVTIRAYGDGERVLQQCLSLIDKANRAFIFLWCENRWLSIRVDVAGALVTFSAALFLLFGSADAALAGFTLSYAITLVDVVLWLVRLYSVVEINLNAVDRVSEYLAIPSEAQHGQLPPAHWPTDTGMIHVRDLAVRYAPEFPRALDGVSFDVRPGEKIGIVGRTGSGKSTLSLAFFRFLEAEAGSITIDGINIADVPLATLRQRLTIIPQDSQLFRGTVRSNLDPFGAADDAEMWFALQRCQLAAPSGGGASAVVRSLDDPVEQGGRNFSAGQRQLLSLARGLLKLRNSRILILDESTANLDSESDALIQQTIRSEMAPGATILTVAHRLKTIIDYDKVLLLDRGRVLEFDTPANLIRNRDSTFFHLCELSGELQELEAAAKGHTPKRVAPHERA